ncbi:MAG: CHASE domain-containing protein [Thiobacillaceae bacterium]
MSVLLFNAWAVLTVAAFGLAWHNGLQQAVRGIEHHAYRHFAQLRDKLRDNEATIHAFAAQLASVPDATLPQIRSLARRLLEPHRHIYMLELVQRVPREGLEAFMAQARRDWHPGFTAKTFDYLQTRTWRPLPDKAEYYLLVMLEPDLSGAAALYGLDTDSVPFLRSTLRHSLESGLPIASEPFRLAEDASLAYVMYRPIQPPRLGLATVRRRTAWRCWWSKLNRFFRRDRSTPTTATGCSMTPRHKSGKRST